MRSVTGQAVARHVDAVVAVGLAAFTVIEATTPGRFPAPVRANVSLALLTGLPLAARQRYPLPVLLTTFGAVLTYAVIWSLPQSAGALLAVLLAVYSLSRHLTGRARHLGTAAVIIAAPVLEWRDPTTRSLGEALPTFLLLAAAWVAGVAARRRTERTQQLTELARQLRQEREELARLAVVRERLHIARELHDVLAHSVSVMVVQVGAARLAAGRLPAPAEEALRSAEQVGRQSLTDMRRLLNVLRDDPDQQRLPQPGLSSVPELVAGSAADIDLHLDPDLPELAPGLDLVIYRVVQEALTNIVKHAPGAAGAVAIRRVGGRIEVAIDNEAPPSPLHPIRTVPGAGHGLIGIAERVTLFGGDVAAGPARDGGFRVLAQIPLTGVTVPDAEIAS